VDVIVVYKVDRLTRSLADFAKMIEILDANKASFVSITQQFNTTSSMGRLTLNVLLSFAQFEREVAGERIRDKIAASKRKGMWMGGTVPLGYDIQDRKLIVNPAEAATIRKIYGLYLELGCVAKLKAQLGKRDIKSKIRVSKAGRKSGGFSYSRGALYELLKNRVYLGEITHRGSSYPGQHEGIISKDVWNKVQAQLVNNNDARRNGVKARHPSLLAGLIHDEHVKRNSDSACRLLPSAKM
jgi:site-specific DNA recombinase